VRKKHKIIKIITRINNTKKYNSSKNFQLKMTAEKNPKEKQKTFNDKGAG